MQDFKANSSMSKTGDKDDRFKSRHVNFCFFFLLIYLHCRKEILGEALLELSFKRNNVKPSSVRVSIRKKSLIYYLTATYLNLRTNT